jgi:hypothetical protein
MAPLFLRLAGSLVVVTLAGQGIGWALEAWVRRAPGPKPGEIKAEEVVARPPALAPFAQDEARASRGRTRVPGEAGSGGSPA